jgi:hypothetical protein
VGALGRGAAALGGLDLLLQLIGVVDTLRRGEALAEVLPAEALLRLGAMAAVVMGLAWVAGAPRRRRGWVPGLAAGLLWPGPGRLALLGWGLWLLQQPGPAPSPRAGWAWLLLPATLFDLSLLLHLRAG